MHPYGDRGLDGPGDPRRAAPKGAAVQVGLPLRTTIDRGAPSTFLPGGEVPGGQLGGRVSLVSTNSRHAPGACTANSSGSDQALTIT